MTELPAPVPMLEVLGEMRFGGRAISSRLRKARELLALLLEARITGRGIVTPLELLDALYPDDIEEHASAATRQLIYRLRKSLGEDVVKHTRGGYALGVPSDAEHFLETFDTRLWRGAYLEGESFVTSTSVPEALYHALGKALEQNLEHAPTEAARVGQLLLRANPYDLRALRLTLRAMHAASAPNLETLYASSRKIFLEIGETLPKTWRAFLEMPLNVAD
jgi:hypothetical protein